MANRRNSSPEQVASRNREAIARARAEGREYLSARELAHILGIGMSGLTENYLIPGRIRGAFKRPIPAQPRPVWHIPLDWELLPPGKVSEPKRGEI